MKITALALATLATAALALPAFAACPGHGDSKSVEAPTSSQTASGTASGTSVPSPAPTKG